MQYQRDRELDACGIGFVADAQGRPSRHIVSAALAGLARVIHRGALAADAKSADGSGVLTPIPAALYGGHGVAQLFVRGDVTDVQTAVKSAASAEGIEVAGWREPPVDDTALGEQALASKPVLLQALLVLPEGCEPSGAAAERAALRLRRRLEQGHPEAYVASCSFRTIVHKGLVAANRLGDFWLDLQDERFEAAFTVFHQRFSTNTLPTWERAQPFRTLCHNGEINAIAGNLNRMRARATLGTEAAGLGPEELFRPVLDVDGSDSAMLDNAVELLTRGGRDIRHAVAMLIPEAWEGVKDLDRPLSGFYRYHASLVEPWDGPAGLVFSDGLGVGASLDRNGLRPLRYAICEDGLVSCCSEAGAIDVSGHGTVTRGRLGPGEMLFVDPSRGVLIDHDCKQRLAAAGPYARWASDGLVRLSSGQPTLETPDPQDLVRRQAAHGYTVEELRMVLKPMAADAKEPVFSMGDDAPLPHLAGRPRPIHHYLRQRFAQVTNPPIDHLRERPVMSLRTLLGPRGPLLVEGPDACRQAELPSFFLFPEGVAALSVGEGSTATVDACYPVSGGPAGLRAAIERVAADAEREVAMGATVVVLDDCGLSSEMAPIPSLLALGATQSRLIEAGLRDGASLVVLADDVRDVHHVACLLGYGADAICPRLALATVASEADASEDSDVLSPEAQERYQAAVEDGVLKVMSKMGISTVDSYRGAQIFEAIGLGPEVVDVCFPGTPSTTGGLGWDALGEDVLVRHAAAELTNPGYYRDLKRGGEHHTHNKSVVDALQAAARADGAAEALKQMAAAHQLQQAIRTGSTERYDAYAALVNGRPPTELRDLLELVPAGDPVPLEEVEPATSILQRFSTGAMSHGSLSREAHETLAMAMNLVGGKSNCGEGARTPAGSAPAATPPPRGTTRTRRSSRSPAGGSGSPPVLRQRRRAADQDRPGVEAGRGRPAARPQGVGRDRQAAPHPARRHPHQPAAPPRHLLDRGPGPAHLRPEAGQHLRRRGRQARGRGRGRHDRRRGGEGAGRRGHDLGRQRGHRCVTALVHQARWPAVGAGAGRHPAGPGREPAAGPCAGAGRRRLPHRPGRVRRRPPGRRRVQLRHRRDDRRGLHHAAGLPQGHLFDRGRHPAAPPAGQVRRHARGCGRLLHLRGRGGPEPAGLAGAAQPRRRHRPGRAPPPARRRRPPGRRDRPQPAAAGTGRPGRRPAVRGRHPPAAAPQRPG